MLKFLLQCIFPCLRDPKCYRVRPDDSRMGMPPEPHDFEHRVPLTRPSSPNRSSRRKKPEVIQHSALLSRLPLEIREQIWEEVLGDYTFHLILGKDPNHVYSHVCVALDRHGCINDRVCRNASHIDTANRPPIVVDQLLSLLISCKQM